MNTGKAVSVFCGAQVGAGIGKGIIIVDRFFVDLGQRAVHVTSTGDLRRVAAAEFPAFTHDDVLV